MYSRPNGEERNKARIWIVYAKLRLRAHERVFHIGDVYSYLQILIETNVCLEKLFAKLSRLVLSSNTREIKRYPLHFLRFHRARFYVVKQHRHHLCVRVRDGHEKMRLIQ